ncbi:NAD(P)-binding protein, partial [Paraburkholderia madseniana]
AALARQGRRVLVLEQHSVAGGLTQTFTRGDWTFATGVHYIGGWGRTASASGRSRAAPAGGGVGGGAGA